MEFLILGPLEIRDNERTIKVDRGQPAALLALLLLNANERVSLDRIVDHLWPDGPPASATKSVQVHVSRLRRALGDNGSAARGRIETRGSGYAIALAPGELDAERFRALVAKATEARGGGDAAGAAELIREALRLWRGPPLADLPQSPLLDPEVASLEEQRLSAHEELIEAELALGRHADVVAELEALARRHPMRERLRAQLMLALYRSGRQAEALQAYQDVRRVLATEAGLEPGPALRDLERAILHQDVALAPAARPAAVTARTRIRSRRLLAAAAVVVVAGVVGVIVFALTPRSSEPNAAGYGNAVVKLSAAAAAASALPSRLATAP